MQMKRHHIIYGIIALALSASLLLVSCGVKNGYVVGEYGKYPLRGEIIAAETNDSSQTVKGTMGLLWQGDSLRITLNQGRQLLRAKTGKDTLYLYEAPRGAESNLQAQAANDTTRQYAIYLPARELFIIKYNDSLVYPVMPATEPCNYPLEIKSMSAKNLNDFKRKQEENEKKPKTQPVLSPNPDYYPFELYTGTYLYDAESYTLGVDCDCITDSNKVFVYNVDGSWQQYENEKITNCGVARKTKRSVFETWNWKGQFVCFLDTASIAGHVISLREDTRRWKENISYAPNEYYLLGKGNVLSLELFPCKKDSDMLLFYIYGDNFILEGTTCGWKKINNN